MVFQRRCGLRSRFLRRHLRAVKLGGFQNDWLNVPFVERLAPQFRVNQRAVTRKPPVMAGLSSNGWDIFAETAWDLRVYNIILSYYDIIIYYHIIPILSYYQFQVEVERMANTWRGQPLCQWSPPCLDYCFTMPQFGIAELVNITPISRSH